jgi:hypothetical protein
MGDDISIFNVFPNPVVATRGPMTQNENKHYRSAAHQSSRRNTSLWCLGVLVVFGVCADARAEMVRITTEQREACSLDVLRLCAESIPNVGAIILCMKQKRASLSPRCQAAIPSSVWKVRPRDLRRLVIR